MRRPPSGRRRPTTAGSPRRAEAAAGRAAPGGRAGHGDSPSVHAARSTATTSRLGTARRTAPTAARTSTGPPRAGGRAPPARRPAGAGGTAARGTPAMSRARSRATRATAGTCRRENDRTRAAVAHAELDATAGRDAAEASGRDRQIGIARGPVAARDAAAYESSASRARSATSSGGPGWLPVTSGSCAPFTASGSLRPPRRRSRRVRSRPGRRLTARVRSRTACDRPASRRRAARARRARRFRPAALAAGYA